MGIGLLLLLSTSRGSWLIAAAGVPLIFAYSRSSRRFAILALVFTVMAGAAVLQTKRGSELTIWFDRTFSERRSLGNRTSGRSDQWLLLPLVMKNAPPWGYGPGMGSRVYAQYSALDPRVKLHPGHRIQWHSLYLQIAVETGLIGIGVLLLSLGVLGYRDVQYWLSTGDIAPVLGVVGFFLIGLTVSGFDAASGLYLGFALLGRTPRRALQKRRRAAARGGEASDLEEAPAT
jgi:O-antigen ligase